MSLCKSVFPMCKWNLKLQWLMPLSFIGPCDYCSLTSVLEWSLFAQDFVLIHNTRQILPCIHPIVLLSFIFIINITIKKTSFRWSLRPLWTSTDLISRCCQNLFFYRSTVFVHFHSLETWNSKLHSFKNSTVSLVCKLSSLHSEDRENKEKDGKEGLLSQKPIRQSRLISKTACRFD